MCSTNLQLYTKNIGQCFDAQLFGRLPGFAVVTSIFATFRLEILSQAVLKGQSRQLALLVGKSFKAKTQIEEWLRINVDIIAIQACLSALQLAIKCLVDDTTAALVVIRLHLLWRRVATVLRCFFTAIDLMKLLGEELEEFVGILLLIASKLLVCLSL